MVALLLSRDGRLVVGVEDDRETGGVRVYVDARYLNRYSLIVDTEACERIRRAWLGHHQHLVASFQDLWPLHEEGRPESMRDPA